MLKLNTISKQTGATHRRKRLGRGPGSGHGMTSGKGDKGQLARSGGHVRPGFEGGQMPLYRRIPKRGFTSMTKRKTATINLSDIEGWKALGLKEVTPTSLQAVLKGRFDRLTVLGNGSVSWGVAVKAHRVSGTAKEAIEKAGGKVEILPALGMNGKKKPKKVVASKKK